MTQKQPEPFHPKQEPAITGSVGDSPNDWNTDKLPLDGSPVKTVVAPPPGYKAHGWRPKTVAEHNARVDEIARERYPVT